MHGRGHVCAGQCTGRVHDDERRERHEELQYSMWVWRLRSDSHPVHRAKANWHVRELWNTDCHVRNDRHVAARYMHG
jgi:hypothetical protein